MKQKSDFQPLFPPPPRCLAQHESRGSAALIIIGLLIATGITLTISTLIAEEQLAQRRRHIWNKGTLIDGVIQVKAKSQIGRKKVQYKYKVGGRFYTDERIIIHIDDFNKFSVGAPIKLRFDPSDPKFSVIALDIVPSFADWIPIEFLVSFIYAICGLIILYGFWLRRILRYGIEVPCTVQPTSALTIVRATYTWQGITRTRLVEGKSEGESVVLLDPNFPAWPLLGMHERFNASETYAPASMSGLRHRWSKALLPGAIGAWVAWGVLSVLTGELMSPHLRTACVLIVAVVLTFIGFRSSNNS